MSPLEEKSKPDWYKSLQTDPLRRRMFTEDLAAGVRSRSRGLPATSSRKVRRTATYIRVMAGAIGLLLLFVLVQSESVRSWLGFGDSSAPAATGRNVAMDFYANEPQRLTPMAGRPAAAPTQTIPLTLRDGSRSASIYLYAENNNSEHITAYLEDNGQWYNTGLISSEGLQHVTAQPASWNNSQIQLAGPMSDWIIKLLRYDEAADVWELYDFEGHGTRAIDLDGDGSPELVSPGETLVPPMVTLHRWNAQTQQVESAQVDRDAANLYNVDRDKRLTYSYLFEEDGQWYIEFGSEGGSGGGRDGGGGNTGASGRSERSHHFLRYEHGRLIEVELEDNTSRLSTFR